MRLRLPHALALAAALLAAAPAHAQRKDVTVRGQVVDTRSGQPVAHAAVYLGNDRTVAVADAQGRFELKHIRPGTRAMWADAPGYSMDLVMVDVPGNEANVTLQMQSDPVRLATLTVSTSRLDRRSRGYAGTARVFREHDLAGMWYSNVLEMVQFRGGVRQTSCPYQGGIGLMRSRASRSMLQAATGPAGECVASRGTAFGSRVFLDEAPWIGGLESLRDFQLSEIARVEIYGQGREVHVFTRQFMDWVSQRPYVPVPIGLM